MIYLYEGVQLGSFPFDRSLFVDLDNLSASLLKDKEVKQYPNLMALAFWCRNIKIDIKEDNIVKKPAGTVFHICPSNVPLMWFYSWVYSFIAGNRNIIKLSSKQFDEVDILIEHFKKCNIINTTIIRYDRDDEITKQISLEADVRMIWGGDETVRHIKSIPSKLTCKDLCFSDKVSYCMLKMDKVDDELCHKFVGDVYSFSQLACSSPIKIFWIGNCPREAFYKRVSEIATERGFVSIADKVRKDLFVYENAMINNFSCVTYGSALTVINGDVFDKCGLGLLQEQICDSIEDVIVDLEKTQTISYYGLSKDEIIECAITNPISRIVPVGQSLNFGRFWDGYDLVRELIKFTVVL